MDLLTYNISMDKYVLFHIPESQMTITPVQATSLNPFVHCTAPLREREKNVEEEQFATLREHADVHTIYKITDLGNRYYNDRTQKV